MPREEQVSVFDGRLHELRVSGWVADVADQTFGGDPGELGPWVAHGGDPHTVSSELGKRGGGPVETDRSRVDCDDALAQCGDVVRLMR